MKDAWPCEKGSHGGRQCGGYHAGVKVYPGTYVEKYAREHGLMPPGFRWSAPYVNEGQRKLFRVPDNIPILLQPDLGLDELRRLRVDFILMRLSSPRFVWEKVKAVVKVGAVRKYCKIVGRGLPGRRH